MKQNLYLFSPRCFVFLLLFCATFAFAQTPVYSLNDDSFVPAINRSLTSPCAATIYDPQGAAGYYLPNQQVVTTYCPDAPNKRMKIDFTMCNLSTGDTLKVYDGNSTTAPLLTTFTGYHNFTQRVVATAANTQSCLTLAFSSNAVGESYGYTGTINCQRICQPIEPSFIISATVPTYPTVAGDSAVNICVGQSVTLTAAAMYPENDVFYHQNDTTTRYLIDWADGRNTLITSAPPHTATHQYNGGSIYFPRIIATEPDSGCFSISPRNLRLRVADKPYFTIHQPASICLGDTVNLLPTVVSTFNPIAVCDPFPIITGNIGTFCISDNGGTADTYTMNNLNYRSIPVNKYDKN